MGNVIKAPKLSADQVNHFGSGPPCALDMAALMMPWQNTVVREAKPRAKQPCISIFK